MSNNNHDPIEKVAGTNSRELTRKASCFLWCKRIPSTWLIA